MGISTEDEFLPLQERLEELKHKMLVTISHLKNIFTEIVERNKISIILCEV